ncbi:MAG: hypothetical protein NUV50_05360 [Rhodospirillales bacterium]|nr:hypothetical protein [Rhodospirillales bacterium]
MPLDLRTTVFSDQELSTALLEYAERNNLKLPLSRVEHVDVVWKPEFSVTLHFVKDPLSRAEKLAFKRNETAAALILYCHRFKEPVPHHAEKSLQPFTGGIQLLLRFPWGDEWSDRHPARKLTFPSMRDEVE